MRVAMYKQRGDTIVEVLISIAVVSLVLAGAFVVTNRSLQATRSAQERSIALKLAESQLEQIKGIVSTNPNALFGTGVPAAFCIAGGAVVNATNASCGTDASGAATTTEPIFHMSITRSGNQFNLTETWTDVSGRQTDKIQLRYRVYQ